MGSVGGDASKRRKSQAVRPAGKRLRREKSAEVYVDEYQSVTGGLAPGIAAEMIFGIKAYAIRPYMHGVFVGVYRIRPTAMNAKNYCSGKHDGAAAF